MNTCSRCDQPALTADLINPLCRRHLIQEQQTVPYTLNDHGALEGTPDPDETPAKADKKPATPAKEDKTK